MGQWVSIGETADVSAGQLRGVRIGELWLAVGRLDDGTLVAFDEWCSHEECQLSEGDLEGDAVACYCHGAVFDVRSGAVRTGPATEPISVYETREGDGRIDVLVDAPGDDVRWTEWKL